MSGLIDRVRAALGDERGRVFYSTCQQLGLRDDDPEVLVALATASLHIDARELGATMTESVKAMREVANELQEILSKFSDSIGPTIDKEVAVAVTTAVDSMSGELVGMARNLAQSEYQAAAVVRTSAINDEVRALSGALAQVQTERAALERDKATAHVEGGGSAAPLGGFVVTKLQLALGCAMMLLLGAGVEWRIASGHASSALHTWHAPTARASSTLHH